MADEFEAARARMIAKRFGGAENVRTGGKGSVRRKRKAQHKASSTGALGVDVWVRGYGYGGLGELRVHRTALALRL